MTARLNLRGSGRTTEAMRSAPKNSVYVWLNGNLWYPKALAQLLGREDLIIVGPSWLTDRRWLGITFPEITLDHATYLTSEQWEAYFYARTRVRK